MMMEYFAYFQGVPKNALRVQVHLIPVSAHGMLLHRQVRKTSSSFLIPVDPWETMDVLAS